MYVYTHTMECYSAIKKEILPFAATWMDLEDVMHSEISQTEKDKYDIWYHLYVESKKQNKQNKQNPNLQGFPGGAVVENPPANAGDTGSNPGPGRSHMPLSNKARAPQLLSLCA